MPRKKKVEEPIIDKDKIQVETLSYTNLFPIIITVIYKESGDFSDIINEASIEYPELSCLRTEDRSNIIAFVYRPTGCGTLFLFMKKDLSMDILAHECIHLTAGVFEMVGADMNEQTEEFFAYINESIFREVLKIIRDRFGFIPEPLYK